MADDADTNTPPTTAEKSPTEHAQAARRGRDGDVPCKAVQEQEQMRAALQQGAGKGQLAINEGGRTNDSAAPDNPEGAVHGLPAPALRGTWR